MISSTYLTGYQAGISFEVIALVGGEYRPEGVAGCNGEDSRPVPHS
jgi:hypothetical protein